MLAFAFFAAVFSTLTWLIYIVMYINDKLGGASFAQLGLLDLSLYVAIAVFPILILWMIFGYINQYLSFAHISQNSKILYQQLKKNLDYTDLIARILLEAEQEVKNSFILNKFELFIADMNELLAETIQRGALASSEQVDRLWHKVKDGAKWAFGKVIIEVSANQPNFAPRLVAKAQNDSVLGGTILEFCARYQNLLNILEKHDKEKVFLSVIETGVYGKVYSILAPLGEQIRRARIDLSEESSIKVHPAPRIEPERIEPMSEEKSLDIASSSESPLRQVSSSSLENVQQNANANFVSEAHKKIKNIFNPFKSRNFFAKNKEVEDIAENESEDKDPFSMALERSFGAPNEEDEKSEPQFENYAFETSEADEFKVYRFSDTKEDEGMPTLSIPTKEESEKIEPSVSNKPVSFVRTTSSRFDEDGIGFTNTQKALNSLKKEWQEMKSASETKLSRSAPDFLRREPVMSNPQRSQKSPIKDDDDYAYPFGGWSDADNYSQK